jgi:hypothetical protein
MRWVGRIGAIWGAVGVFSLLGFAIYRLAPLTVTAYKMGLTAGQWVVGALFVVFMVYSEGYRGFHLRFSPRTAARVRYLRDEPNVIRSLLGPLFAMGFFHATRRTKLTAWFLSLGIVILVLLVHRLEQPWRGIIDAGVVIGLGLGQLSLLWCLRRALADSSVEFSPEVPVGESRH